MTTNPTVVIPWRPARGRWANYAAVREFYLEHFPTWPVLDVPGPSVGPFNLAAARNMGVAYAAHRPESVVVLNDADTIPSPDSLELAVDLARSTKRVVIGYDTYLPSILIGGRHAEPVGEPIATAISGVYVTTPQAWWRTHGQDERFSGWAPEDYAWLVAYRAIVGEEPLRVAGRAYALGHDPAPRSGEHYDRMVARYQRYLEASSANDVETIRHLAAGGA